MQRYLMLEQPVEQLNNYHVLLEGLRSKSALEQRNQISQLWVNTLI
jgi:hypothetical protein